MCYAKMGFRIVSCRSIKTLVGCQLSEQEEVEENAIDVDEKKKRSS